MATNYKPKESFETRTAVKLLIPTIAAFHGVQEPEYPSDGHICFVNWKSYGGTEVIENGVRSILDTATVTMRYRPDVRAGCRFLRTDGAVYEIKGEPENVDMNGLWLICKVDRVKGYG